MSCSGDHDKHKKSPQASYVQVRWQGSGSKKITGSYTGKLYRFAERGSVVSVDAMDAPNVMIYPGRVEVGR